MTRARSYTVHESTCGDHTHYRFSLKLEGGGIYYSPFFFRTHEDAEDKARRALAERSSSSSYAGVARDEQRI